jgi:CheY-like chemotaxis protein
MRPKAIIMDVLLQGEHSWDLLRELKQDPAMQNLPAYVITVVDNRDKALSLGADGFHSKPVDRIWLLNQLEPLATTTTKPKVLVVDDDATARYLVRSLLASSGVELLEADGGESGLRMARDEQPDLIVLDLAMDDIDGFAFLKILRGNSATKQIPVVVHTSKSLESDDYARLSSAIDVIPKSIMSSRELAMSRFSDAFQKAGLDAGSRVHQPVAS